MSIMPGFVLVANNTSWAGVETLSHPKLQFPKHGAQILPVKAVLITAAKQILLYKGPSIVSAIPTFVLIKIVAMFCNTYKQATAFINYLTNFKKQYDEKTTKPF